MAKNYEARIVTILLTKSIMTRSVSIAVMGTILFLTGMAQPNPPSLQECAAVPNRSRVPCGYYETRRRNMHGRYDFGEVWINNNIGTHTDVVQYNSLIQPHIHSLIN